VREVFGDHRLDRTFSPPPPQMVAAPRWRRTRSLLAHDACLLPLALAYALLLAASWTPDTLATIMPGSLAAGLAGGFRPQFFPALGGVAALFARPATAASLWAHLLAVNLFAARLEYLTTPVDRPVWITSAVVALIACAGPAGLAAAAAVRGAAWCRRRRAAAAV